VPLVEDAVELALQNVRTLALDLQLTRAPLAPPPSVRRWGPVCAPMQKIPLSFVWLPTGGSARHCRTQRKSSKRRSLLM
jgi:hypothetical protein